RENGITHPDKMRAIANAAVDHSANCSMSSGGSGAQFAVQRYMERSAGIAHFHAWRPHLFDHAKPLETNFLVLLATHRAFDRERRTCKLHVTVQRHQPVREGLSRISQMLQYIVD